MIVFNDGRYYQIIEDLECLKKWVTNVETSHIFCARNVTTYFDEPYNFTIWPVEPTYSAMEIYKEHGMWNGITVSKINKDYTELYWFTKQNAENGWHKWFIRNKLSLLKFIEHFEKYKDALCIQNNQESELFRFKQEFNMNFLKSQYVENELLSINRMITSLQLDPIIVANLQKRTNLSSREIEVLAIIGRGYNTKIAAQTLAVSERTIKFHVERIKLKAGLHFKHELIQLCEKQSITRQ